MITPEHVADQFSLAVAAHLRGDRDEATTWLEAHWTAAPAPEPNEPPAAVSLLGSMPAVRWYRRDEAIVGYAVGRNDGCYWMPFAAASEPGGTP